MDPRGAPTTFTQTLYAELRSIAAAVMARQAHDRTLLHPTSLVNEAYLKLFGREERDWNDRTHLLSAAALAMRQILVDGARARGAVKNGAGAQRLTFLDPDACIGRSEVDLLPLDEALDRLAQLDERKARVVELRFFGGLSMREVASSLQISISTAESDWRFARAWLRDQLSGSGRG